MAEKKRREYGSGSVSQRADGTWTARVVIGRNENGKPKVKALYGKTESEVKKKLKEYQKERIKYDIDEVKKGTLSEYMKEWLYTVKKNELKPTSFDYEELVVNEYICKRIGLMQIASINTSHIQKMINDVKDAGYKYNTVRKVYIITNEFFKYSILARHIVYNPCAGVKMPKASTFESKEIIFYNEEEVKKLYETSLKLLKNGKRKYRMGDIVIVALNTGMRVGELIALKWSNVDLENRLVYVVGTVVCIKDRDENSDKRYKTIAQDTTKTASGKRVIPLNDDAYDAFMRLKEISGQFDHVFTTKDGAPCAKPYIYRTVTNIEKDSGFQDDKIYGMHALRHTFATLLIKNNVDINTVSALLGHSKVSITLEIYVHVIEEQKMKAVQKLVVPKIV